MASYTCPECKADVTAQVLRAAGDSQMLYRDRRSAQRRQPPRTVHVHCPNGHLYGYTVG
jgi:hypothetical protein